MRLFDQLIRRIKPTPVPMAVHDDALLPLGEALPPLPPPPQGYCEKAGIVIVSFFGLSYLRQCLESVFGRTVWPNFKVVVVDNGSDAETLSFLREFAMRESRLQVVENGRNLGFAAANNIGLRMLKDCQTLVLLNNDVVVPPNWLGKLAGYASNPEFGLVGPVTNWTGNEARIKTNYRTLAAMERFASELEQSHAARFFDIPVLAMYCVAFRRDVYEQTGELDEGYKVGMFEDVDYAEAVRRLGLRVVCCEDVFVHHYGMASFSKLAPAEYQRLFADNRAHFENKWGCSWVPHRAR